MDANLSLSQMKIRRRLRYDPNKAAQMFTFQCHIARSCSRVSLVRHTWWMLNLLWWNKSNRKTQIDIISNPDNRTQCNTYILQSNLFWFSFISSISPAKKMRQNGYDFIDFHQKWSLRISSIWCNKFRSQRNFTGECLICNMYQWKLLFQAWIGLENTCAVSPVVNKIVSYVSNETIKIPVEHSNIEEFSIKIDTKCFAEEFSNNQNHVGLLYLWWNH